jgi:hypothetical protein
LCLRVFGIFLSQWKIERKEEQGNYNSQED